ncbi:cytochrome c [Neokomagataea tanensis]|uniref:Cytochrome c n=3 Tax=Acetobacteraceae TaxID=433 RepID=A0A4Y6V8R1_9PROT|nr:cytochrome c [Neokomagataea tanensis]
MRTGPFPACRTLLCGFVLLASLSACGRKSPGAHVYGPHCGICHHGGGGMPGETPPLVGRLDIIAQTPEGRTYLANVLLYGLEGPFKTQGYSYRYSMPGFASQLSDHDIAVTLNWLIDQGETKPAPHITDAEVAAARTHIGTPTSTYKLRATLDQTHPLP